MRPVDNYTCDTNDTNKLKPSAQEVSYWFETTYLLVDYIKTRASAVAFLIFFPSVCVSVNMYSRWVNSLGIAAMQGIDVVLRHSFFDYGYTHLVDQHFNPLPVSLSIGVQQGLEWLLVHIFRNSVHSSSS